LGPRLSPGAREAPTGSVPARAGAAALRAGLIFADRPRILRGNFRGRGKKRAPAPRGEGFRARDALAAGPGARPLLDRRPKTDYFLSPAIFGPARGGD
jgi:hypothetical protein